MASGRQLAEQNFDAFVAWSASKTDDDFRAMASRGVLARKEIAVECGFAKSALDQNPRIKAALRDLEDSLRARQVLPELVAKASEGPQEPRMRESGGQKAMLDSERLKRLEQENASLRAELSEVKRALEKHAVLREALSLTGRLPR
jgi:hypothetical protein